MTRLPLFQGINIPQGLAARIPYDLAKIFASMTLEEYLAYMQTLFNLMQNQTGAQIIVGFAPVVSSFTSNTLGTELYLAFDLDMTDPTGTELEWTVLINGVSKSVDAITLHDSKTFKITLVGTTLIYSDTVTISYTAGSITSAAEIPLASFTAQALTNNSKLLYPNSAYPYQVIVIRSGYADKMCISKARFYVNDSLKRMFQRDPFEGKYYDWTGTAWGSQNVFGTYVTYTDMDERNHDITAVPPDTTVVFAETINGWD